MRKNHEAIILPAVNSIVYEFAEMSTLFHLSITSNKGNHRLKRLEDIGINEIVHFKSEFRCMSDGISSFSPSKTVQKF